MNFRVAIFLASYNGAVWIQEQIESILRQAEVDVTIFVGDDCSSDETLNIIARAFPGSARVIVLNETQKRFGSPAANFFRIFDSVSVDDYDYIFLSDQDDFWHEGKIISGIKKMISEGSDCYASDLVCVYSNGIRKNLKKSYRQTENDFLFQGASAGCTYGMTARAAKLCKEVILAVPEDVRKVVSHDWMIYAITRSHSYRWSLDSAAYIDYRQHDGNAYGALGLKSYKKRYLLLRSGWYRKNVIAVGNVCSLNPAQSAIMASLRKWGLRDRIFLLSRSWSFRRKTSEKFYMMALIVLNLF